MLFRFRHRVKLGSMPSNVLVGAHIAKRIKDAVVIIGSSHLAILGAVGVVLMRTVEAKASPLYPFALGEKRAPIVTGIRHDHRSSNPTMMKEGFKKICELQPLYSADNTYEMQERGSALRNTVKPALVALAPVLVPLLGPFGGDFHVDASDGIGRKTELPWVRFCSRGMSPHPTEGFYCVVHFSTDGSAMHVTIGCGSSRFVNGYSVVLPDDELNARTSWARSIILEKFGSLEPFTDSADYGAKRKLTQAFQRATAISKRIAYEDIGATDVEALLSAAAVRLRIIYEAQSMGRDLSPADQAAIEIAAIVNPNHFQVYRQGYGLPAEARRVVELRAMELAIEWLRERGYSVADCSRTQPYDLEATLGFDTLKVEVKGTTSDHADAILMTRNEVDLHSAEKGRTALIIVSRISIEKSVEEFRAMGGIVEAMIGWDIGEWLVEPTAYRVARK